MAAQPKAGRAPQHSSPVSHTPLWTIFLVAGCTFFMAAAQVMLKLGRKPGLSPLNMWIIIGMLIYVIAGLTITFALKHGELSVIYPVISLGFIWVSLASYFWLHELLPPHQIAGTFSIILGVSIIGHRRRRA